jgi:hypothetical protein
MGKFVAVLTGETDQHTISKEFGEEASAIAWLEGEGLAAFPDQMARGEISLHGKLVWTRSHLQTAEQAGGDSKVWWRRLRAKAGIAERRRR